MKPHNPQLAAQFKKEIPTRARLTSPNSLSLTALAGKIREMWKFLNHYNESLLQRMSQDLGAVWIRVNTDSISTFVKTAKINAINSRMTTISKKMMVKIDAQERGRLFLANGGFQDNLDKGAVYKCGQCKHSFVDIPPPFSPHPREKQDNDGKA
jgi:hypothetical protein